MKKLMWILSLIPLVVTSFVLPLMPETVPMHKNIEGVTDRWGSRIELLILPILILAITFFWQAMIVRFEKKALNAATDKDKQGASSNAKYLGIVGAIEAAFFGIMHYFIMFSAYVEATRGGENVPIDFLTITCILSGVLFIVLGNYITKTRINSMAGVRTKWSMYNDTTWRESNRFGGIALAAAGLATIITAAITSGAIASVLLLVYITIATVMIVKFSQKVYNKETSKEK